METFSERNVSYHPLQLVNFYLATATYDNIERDVKVTTEAALGLIGGTMGLFTGFSILSGVEIFYYLSKSIISQMSHFVLMLLALIWARRSSDIKHL